MENNVIYKEFLHQSALNTARDSYNSQNEILFKNTNPFELFNIIGKNRLLVFGVILLIFYSWFIRANISIGALFGLLLLGFIFYLYYNYQFFQIKNYAIDKQQKETFLADILAVENIYPIEGTSFFSRNYFKLDYEKLRNYLYFNPAVVDFYYANKEVINHSYLNYARSLQHINAMTILQTEILFGLENRGNQLEELKYLRKKCLNYWQAIIYNIPSTTATYTKYKNSMKILEELTQKYIDGAELKIREQNDKDGINMAYYPIYKGGPEPNDTKSFNYSSHFDFF